MGVREDCMEGEGGGHVMIIMCRDMWFDFGAGKGGGRWKG